jgi:hypothetical protein
LRLPGPGGERGCRWLVERHRGRFFQWDDRLVHIVRVLGVVDHGIFGVVDHLVVLVEFGLVHRGLVVVLGLVVDHLVVFVDLGLVSLGLVVVHELVVVVDVVLGCVVVGFLFVVVLLLGVLVERGGHRRLLRLSGRPDVGRVRALQRPGLARERVRRRRMQFFLFPDGDVRGPGLRGRGLRDRGVSDGSGGLRSRVLQRL